MENSSSISSYFVSRRSTPEGSPSKYNSASNSPILRSYFHTYARSLPKECLIKNADAPCKIKGSPRPSTYVPDVKIGYEFTQIHKFLKFNSNLETLKLENVDSIEKFLGTLTEKIITKIINIFKFASELRVNEIKYLDNIGDDELSDIYIKRLENNFENKKIFDIFVYDHAPFKSHDSVLGDAISPNFNNFILNIENSTITKFTQLVSVNKKSGIYTNKERYGDVDVSKYLSARNWLNFPQKNGDNHFAQPFLGTSLSALFTDGNFNKQISIETKKEIIYKTIVEGIEFIIDKNYQVFDIKPNNLVYMFSENKLYFIDYTDEAAIHDFCEEEFDKLYVNNVKAPSNRFFELYLCAFNLLSCGFQTVYPTDQNKYQYISELIDKFLHTYEFISPAIKEPILSGKTLFKFVLKNYYDVEL